MTLEKVPATPMLALLLVFGLSGPGWAGFRVNTASPITVITGEEVERLPARPITDFMSLVPGVSSGTAGEPTRFLVNGIRSPESDRLIPKDDVERIEILNGSTAATLYGGELTADVINFVTKDDYSGFNVGGSWVLQNVMNSFKDIWISTENGGECDTTNGEFRPTFTLFDRYDFGGPDFAYGGKTWLWGSQSRGFEPGGYGYPKFGLSYPDLTDTESMKRTGFSALAALTESVTGDPSLSEGAKSGFMAGLSIVLAYGPDSLSDRAHSLGHFDPVEIYRQLSQYMASGATGPAFTPTPQTQTDEVGGDEQLLSQPFAGYRIPPKYLLENPNDCPEEVVDSVRPLIREWAQARGGISYSMDYLRYQLQSGGDTGEQVRKAEEARKLRDQKNNEIKDALRTCVPQTASTEASAPTATSGAEAQSGSWGRWSDDLKLQINFSRNELGDDGAVYKVPAPDVRVGLHPYNPDLDVGIPWGFRSSRDTDKGASEDGHSKITAADGSVIFDVDWYDPGVAAGFRMPTDWSLVESYETGAKSNWTVRVDWDTSTIKLRSHLEKTDSFVQLFAGQAQPSSASIQHVPTGLFANYVSNEFPVGGNLYRVYDNIPEYLNLDLSQLYSIPGQTSVENNSCGESALPQNGLGYLSQAASPVQSVEDQWALEQVGLTADAALSERTSSAAAPIVIGVIDTGLDWNHLDFAWENIWRNEDEIPDNGVDDDGNGYVDDIIGWDFMNQDNKPWDNDGHGTFVSGIIAATHNNGAGIDGIDPNARVMVLKALNNFGRTRASYVAQAIVYGADNGARILNLSVSGGEVPGVVIDAVAYARGKGVLVITAAGNRGENIDRGPPGGVPGLMSVAATGPDDNRAVFSNVGSSINIAAPGVDIVSLRARRTDFMLNSATTTYQARDAYLGDDNRYYRSAGTSFATPIVSGIASLVWSSRPELTATQVQRILEQSARDVGTPGRDRFTGYGVVDAPAALGADPEFFVEAAILQARPVEEDEQVFVQVFGSADANQFGRAWLEIGEGEDPSHWIPIGDALPDTVRLGVLGMIPAAQLDGANVWTVRVLVEHQNSRLREARYVIELG